MLVRMVLIIRNTLTYYHLWCNMVFIYAEFYESLEFWHRRMMKTHAIYCNQLYLSIFVFTAVADFTLLFSISEHHQTRKCLDLTIWLKSFIHSEKQREDILLMYANQTIRYWLSICHSKTDTNMMNLSHNFVIIQLFILDVNIIVQAPAVQYLYKYW